mgnify:CR=1 FL=1
MIHKIIIAFIIGLFIYHRKVDYYKTMPRQDLRMAFIISLWAYFSMVNNWFIIAGLIVLNVLGHKRSFK